MMKSVRRSIRLSCCVSVISLAVAFAANAETRPEPALITFNIPAETTAEALLDYSRQAHIQILFPYDVAAKHSAPAIVGTFTREAAFRRLLDGSGLVVAEDGPTAVTLKAAATTGDQAPSASGASASGGGAAANEDPSVKGLVITGTHLRGVNPTSPVHTISRKDIDQSGFSQIDDVMRSLPENFSGGQNPGVLQGSSITNGGNLNATNASTVNLRGLGADATLVLLNGHRLAADGYMQGVDISGIPLAAVQRVEIVPDGASALYGSDAVAGVVNIAMRRNFTGSEVSARFGGATQGGAFEQTFNVLSGVSGAKGYGLANLQYSRTGAVLASDRSFTRDAVPQNMLLQPEVKQSLYVSAGRDLTDAVQVTFDGIISDRRTHGFSQQTAARPTTAISTVNETPSYSAVAGLEAAGPGGWKFHLSGVLSGSRTRGRTSTTTRTAYSNYTNAAQTLEASADGTLVETGAGAVKAAFGLGVRDEAFHSTTIGASRTVKYAFVEIQAPLVAPSDTRVGLNGFEVSLAGRSESNSDFGNSANPKLGFRYVPFPNLSLRGSIGKSFKAPAFLQLYNPANAYFYPAVVFTGATKPVLYTAGGNPDLAPEKSKSWSLGADFKPDVMGSATLSATWFDIDYKDRIINPLTDPASALVNPAYAPFVTLSPSEAEASAVVASSDNFYNTVSTTFDPSTVGAIVRNSYQNATAQTVKGLDLSYRQAFHFGAGTLGAFANATWLKLEQQTLVTQLATRLSGTIFNAPKLKARAGVNWQSGGWSVTGVANYLSGEVDTGVTPSVDVASWTTIDSTITYTFAQTRGVTRGLRLVLAASNLLDADPPRTTSSSLSYKAFNYDSANASALGRFLSLTVNKAF